MADRLLYGSVPPYRGSRLSVVRQPETVRASWVFDSHRTTIAESAGSGNNNKGPQSVSLAWDENAAWGSDDYNRTWEGLDTRQQKEIYLSMYLANPWASACVDVIAKRITSGGYVIEPTVEKPNPRHKDRLDVFLRRVNPDWDFLQYTRASIIDKLIFGETYTEVLEKSGLPWQIYKIDCLTMSYKPDRSGHIIEYVQQLQSDSEINYLDPETIIRWWFPHPRAALDAFPPLDRVRDAWMLDKKMVNWMTTFFAKGAKFPYTIEFPGDQDEADRFLTWFRANYTGEKNAHLPPTTWGGAKITVTGKGAIDIDFPHGRDRNRTEILSAFHVPPAAVGIIESGNIGGGTGEDQDKSLQYNACDPIKHAFLEKFNYRIVQQGFGITDYKVGLRYADYRNDESLAKVQDMRIRNGSILIDESRQEMGKPPYADGSGAIPVIITTKEVTPVPRLKDLEDEQRETAQATLITAQANADLAKTKAAQAKEPPPAPPETPDQGDGNKTTNIIAAKSTASKQQSDDGKEEESAHASLPSHAAVLEQVLAVFAGHFNEKESAHAHLQRRTLRNVDIATTQSPPYQESGAGLAQSQRQDAQTRIAASGASDRAFAEASGQYTGMMLALFPDIPTAEALAIPGGEVATDLHITLAYLPADGDDVTRNPTTNDHARTDLLRIIDSVAASFRPISGCIGGIGRFAASASSDMKDVCIALVDVPGLSELRARLCSTLEINGFAVAKNHGYTPHITLAYIDPTAEMPVESVPSYSLQFDTVWVCIGDERIPFDLGALAPSATAQESADDNDQSDADQQKADLAAAILAIFAAIASRGLDSFTDLASAAAAFAVTSDERDVFIEKLASAYLAAQLFAFNRDIAVAGFIGDARQFFTLDAAIAWATGQVGGIFETFAQQLGNFIKWLPQDIEEASAKQQISDWFDRYAGYKAPQIANVTVGAGTNEGTKQAIHDMLDAGLGQPITSPPLPDQPKLPNIRIRVVPGDSSSDFCKDYAGNDYSLGEALSLPSFPAHPGCIHGIEAYDAGADDEEEV